jgi:hypothetical protein
VPGGVAPMSLMTYEEAYPWAESIRGELIAAHMPPWNADDAFGALKGAHTLSPKELDVVLTWASGGNPPGSLDQKLPAVTLRNDWVLGPPDTAIPLDEFTLAADKMEDTREFVVKPAGDPRWLRAIDLLPGTPSIVRSAIVFVKTDDQAPPSAASGAPSPERVLARWVPGHDAEPLANGLGYSLPSGASIVVRVHYKKTWQFEGKPLKDRSTLGLYTGASGTAHELLTIPIAGPPAQPGSSDSITFSHTVQDDVQALAISPDDVPANITVQVRAVRPDGTHIPLIRINTRADWGRRYWFAQPIALARGTRLEVVADLRDPDLFAGAFAAPTSKTDAPRPAAVRLSLDVVRGAGAGAAP